MWMNMSVWCLMIITKFSRKSEFYFWIYMLCISGWIAIAFIADGCSIEVDIVHADVRPSVFEEGSRNETLLPLRASSAHMMLQI